MMEKIKNLIAALLIAATLQGASAAGIVDKLYVPSGADALPRSVVAKLKDVVVTPQDFGAKCDDTADDTAKVQAALNSMAAGGRLYVRGTCKVTAALTVPSNVNIDGDGWNASVLHFTNTGDGITSASPINSSTVKNVSITNISVKNTSGASTGGGIVDVAGSYINVENCLVQGWKYNIILDQSEHVVIRRNNILGWVTAGIWIVNGADHTAGANTNYTNRLTIADNQLNNGSTGYAILDDGGVNHLISGNNFNAGLVQIRTGKVSGLSIINNEFETAQTYAVWLTDTTLAGAYVGPSTAIHIHGNTFGYMTVGVFMGAARGGNISANAFYSYTEAAIEYDNGTSTKITGIDIGGNSKGLTGGSQTALPFLVSGQQTYLEKQGSYTQNGQTYSASATSAGYQQITPATMEGIYDGAQLRIMNADGTLVETVTAQLSTASTTTFFATFANAHAAAFLINVMDGQTRGTYTPTLAGSTTPGSFTTSANYASWSKNKNRVTFQANATWSAIGGATGQMTITLPFPAKNDSGVSVLLPVYLTGPGAVGGKHLFMSIGAGATTGKLVYVDSSTGNAAGFDPPASGTMTVSGSYEL